jgi:hypothetical protein
MTKNSIFVGAAVSSMIWMGGTSSADSDTAHAAHLAHLSHLVQECGEYDAKEPDKEQTTALRTKFCSSQMDAEKCEQAIEQHCTLARFSLSAATIHSHDENSDHLPDRHDGGGKKGGGSLWSRPEIDDLIRASAPAAPMLSAHGITVGHAPHATGDSRQGKTPAELESLYWRGAPLTAREKEITVGRIGRRLSDAMLAEFREKQRRWEASPEFEAQKRREAERQGARDAHRHEVELRIREARERESARERSHERVP